MLNLTGGGLSGGYRKYLQRLVPLLRTHRDISELLVVAPPGYEALAGDDGNVWTWQKGEQLRGFPELRERVRAWSPDVVFIPTARYLDCDVPCVCMIRNMEPMLPATFRDGLTLWTKGRLRGYVARRAAVRARRVIAVSEFVREHIVTKWHVDADRVGIVYHGVDRIAPPSATPKALQPLAGTPYVFAAGSLLPYRGLEDAIGALAQLTTPSVKLAVAGDGLNAYGERMTALAERLGVRERIEWLGHVDEATMTYAFRQCIAFLMTSRVEACPNTALEAMANGAVCVSTTCPPMPEFFGDTALYYEAGDAGRLAQHIDSVLAMPVSTIQSLRRAAHKRVSAFAWERTAAETIAELQTALAQEGAISRNDVRVGALQRIR